MYQSIKNTVLNMIYMLTQIILDKSLIFTRIFETVKMIIYRIKLLVTKSYQHIYNQQKLV